MTIFLLASACLAVCHGQPLGENLRGTRRLDPFSSGDDVFSSGNDWFERQSQKNDDWFERQTEKHNKWFEESSNKAFSTWILFAIAGLVVTGLGACLKVYLNHRNEEEIENCNIQTDHRARAPVVHVHPTVDLNQTVGRSQSKSTTVAAFEAMDTDGDGQISREELQVAMKGRPLAAIDAVFDALDTDGDGQISRLEFDSKLSTEERLVGPRVKWAGLWLMEWSDGQHIVASLEDGEFEALGQLYSLQLTHTPPRFQWLDGTVQELQAINKDMLTWVTKKKFGVVDKTLHWVRVPACPCSQTCVMKLTKNLKGTACQKCQKMIAKDGKNWRWHCASHELLLCADCAVVPPEPERPVLGISAAYLVNVFPEVAHFATKMENPNFYEIAPALAMGPNGLGFGKTCPRDGKPDCSIVDAVHDRHKGKVTHFVSWCWAYKLEDFVNAIALWAKKEGLTLENVYLWVCFFCNNQYRILESGVQTGSDELKDVFESHLAAAGKMLVLLDSFVDPIYIRRAWCIFESFVCIDRKFPMTFILPERAEGTFIEILDEPGSFSKLKAAFESMDVRYAEASGKADEDMIKKLILTTTGFDSVNKAVQKCLLDWLTNLFQAQLSR